MCSASIAGTSYPMMTTMMNNFAVTEMGVNGLGRRVLWWLGGVAVVGAAVAAWAYSKKRPLFA